MVEAQRVSLHVAAWDHQPYLLDLCASLERQTYRDVQALISEYASVRDQEAGIQKTYPNVVSLRHFQVQSFTAVHNRMIAFALARWAEAVWEDRFIVIAHPDVILEPECLARLVRAFEIDRELMVAGPKMLEATAHWFEEGDDGCRVEFTDQLDSVGQRLDRRRRLRSIGAGEQDQGQYRERMEVFAVSSTFFMVRASALVALKKDGPWLDEALGETATMIDLAWRLQLMGGKVASIPTAVLWHHAHAPKESQSDLWARLKKWYGVVGFTERVLREELWLVRAKNEQAMNGVLSLPWLIVDWFQGLLVTLIDPRLWFVHARTVIKLPYMWSQRFAFSKKVRLSAKEMRERLR